MRMFLIRSAGKLFNLNGSTYLSSVLYDGSLIIFQNLQTSDGGPASFTLGGTPGSTGTLLAGHSYYWLSGGIYSSLFTGRWRRRRPAAACRSRLERRWFPNFPAVVWSLLASSAARLVARSNWRPIEGRSRMLCAVSRPRTATTESLLSGVIAGDGSRELESTRSPTLNLCLPLVGFAAEVDADRVVEREVLRHVLAVAFDQIEILVAVAFDFLGRFFLLGSLTVNRRDGRRVKEYFATDLAAIRCEFFILLGVVVFDVAAEKSAAGLPRCAAGCREGRTRWPAAAGAWLADCNASFSPRCSKPYRPDVSPRHRPR